MEQSNVPSQELPKPEEVLLPKEQIRPLARGLIQLFAEPTQIINDNLPLLDTETNVSFKNVVDEMKSSMQKIELLLKGLLTAKEAKFVIKPEGEEFVFSEEKEEDIPEEGSVTIDAILARKLTRALSHTIGTPFSIVVGYSELLTTMSSSEEVKNQAKTTNEASVKMLESFNPIRNAHILEMNTDQGQTKIQAVRITEKLQGEQASFNQ